MEYRSTFLGSNGFPKEGRDMATDLGRLCRVSVLLATFLAVLNVPAGTAPAGYVYVADRGNNRIVRMNDMSGAGWLVLGTRGSGAKPFNFPRGLFVDTVGILNVSDNVKHRALH